MPISGQSQQADTLPTTLRALALRWALPVACLMLVVALALGLELRQTTQTLMLMEQRVSLERYLDGTVARPFAYRVLVPQTIRLLDRLTPKEISQAVEAWGEPIGRRILPQSVPAEARRLDYYFLVAIQLLSLFGYAIIGHRLYVRLFPATPFHWLIPVGFLAMLIPIVAGRFGHLYDFTVLLFMAALLYAIATHRHGLYLALFALSCLDKETTILATVAYASYFVDRLPRRKFLLMIAGQVSIFLLIYLGLRHHFAANPGHGMEIWLREQLDWLSGRTFSEYLCFLAVLSLIGFQFGEKPLVMRRAMWMVAANVALFVLAASPGEWRNLYESVPLLTLFVLRNFALLTSRGLNGLGARPD